MKRHLLVCLAAVYLLGAVNASPVYAGSCPQGLYDYCDMWCMMTYSVPAYDVCYILNEQGPEFAFCICDNGEYGECSDYGALSCAVCC